MILGAFTLLLAEGAANFCLLSFVVLLNLCLLLKENVDMSLDLLVEVGADCRLFSDLHSLEETSFLC